ncbi:MAG: hypothetical protein H6506_04340 [Calditrichaeota bacterium]|nr:hypothetical protein [Calditrichota bacterium]MCB9366012.1 hypothetical protein [Calditrichota bacterium]MCB9391862.1 hypothetical protein [Calditrichota bacterium]
MSDPKDQLITSSSGEHGDLPEKLRQISAALWEAAETRNFQSMQALLEQREAVLSQLAPSRELTAKERRELMAVQAAERYLIRQLSSEAEFLERRLRAVGARRSAAKGYRSPSKKSSRLMGTG